MNKTNKPQCSHENLQIAVMLIHAKSKGCVRLPMDMIRCILDLLDTRSALVSSRYCKPLCGYCVRESNFVRWDLERMSKELHEMSIMLYGKDYNTRAFFS
jgi:hypothetical protein